MVISITQFNYYDRTYFAHSCVPTVITNSTFYSLVPSSLQKKFQSLFVAINNLAKNQYFEVPQQLHAETWIYFIVNQYSLRL